ncbi:MAG: 5'-nucleotidase, lipoprotein e(P4) family [Bacteroidales bacterium]|nr:5'-nucleotidase, lipoprotein e(P4) family [Bacteroidales bacterium]
MKRFLFLFTVSLLFFSCVEKQVVNEDVVIEQNISDNLLNAVAWFQQSAENEACYIQAFNLAKNQLILNIKNSSTNLPKAVIVDIDETMLDNSPFEGYLIKNDLEFTSDLWSQWVQLAAAEALPGAIDFSLFAQQNNVEVFYVSNRHVDNFQPTLINLQQKGFAYADSSHVLLKSTTSDKTERRAIIAENFEIIMLIGDNLRDFDEKFKQRQTDFGKNLTSDNANLFGTKYIILPNPMYGEWQKTYRSDNDTTPTQEFNRMRDMIIGF